MLTVYLTFLVAGGVFVGLSSLGGLGQGLEAEAEVDADVDVHADVDVDADVDADADVGADTDPGPDAPPALALAEGSHGLVARDRASKRWVPLLSFRFWTFGAAFFGLAGTLLTLLTGLSVPVVAVVSAATGVAVGTLSAWMIRWLRRPVGTIVRVGEYSGQTGELMLPLREGGVTRIRLRVGGRERSMLAAAPEPLALPAGTRVVVLGIDGRGRAQITPEDTLYKSED